MGQERKPLRTLIVEDLPEDAELLLWQLRESGYEPDWVRVDVEKDYLKALESKFDLILADYTLPQFDAMRALRLLQKLELDIPFVVVTGSTGEERAVACMREGASDYLLKDRLARLGPAVSRVLEQRSLQNEKRRVEADLKKTEELFRFVVENAHDLILVVDEAWHVRYASPALTRILRHPIDRKVDRPVLDDVHSEDRAVVEDSLRRSFAAPGEPQSFTARFRDAEGEWRLLESIGSSHRSSDGEKLGVINARDVTERHRAEEERQALEAQLRQAQKMEAIGLLAGGVAHDFNNLVTIVFGQCYLLQRGELTEQATKRVKAIERASERAASLTSQLLAFSRRQVLSPHVVDLNVILAEMSDMLERVLSEDILVETCLTEEEVHVKADRNQLEQVILNLAVNARDAMPDGGRLTISTSTVEVDKNLARKWEGMKPGSFVSMRIKDRGVGMEPETLARVFEPFFTTKELGRGTGLGLSTVYGIVKQSDGHIYATSAPGEGTVFELFLPRVHEPVTSVAATPPSPFRGQGKLLVVEDDTSLRELIRDVLAQAGYDVVACADARECFGVLERANGEVDAVITDVVMPGMKGDELADLIGKRYPRVRVVFTSGYLDRNMKAFVANPPTMIRKPFPAWDLVRAVNEILDTGRESDPQSS